MASIKYKLRNRTTGSGIERFDFARIAKNPSRKNKMPGFRMVESAFMELWVGRDEVELILRSGSLGDLIRQLEDRTLDLVLSNLPERREAERNWHSQLIEEQSVSLVGTKSRRVSRLENLQELNEIPRAAPDARQRTARGV